MTFAEYIGQLMAAKPLPQSDETKQKVAHFYHQAGQSPQFLPAEYRKLLALGYGQEKD